MVVFNDRSMNFNICTVTDGMRTKPTGQKSGRQPFGVLYARQLNGQIYFYGLETIPANVELVVTYSGSYREHIRSIASLHTSSGQYSGTVLALVT
jgi:hypothetical protein